MSRSSDSHIHDPLEQRADSDGLDGFGFDLPDESWIERIRAAERPLDLGRLGPYEILKEISRGAQGVVYQARQKDTNRVIAVKRLLAGELATQSMRSRFAREIETAARLHHPNIVTVYGTDLVGDQPVLAMEWIDGQPIDAWVRDSARAGHAHNQRLETFALTCDAVHFAHQRGVIHRDLKPTNILVDREGKPHILDFGLAKTIEQSAGENAGITLTQDFIGTPLFAAPEQARSDHAAVDVRTDVFALGTILYCMLTSQTPHTGPLHTILDAIQNQDAAPPSRLNQNIGRELDAITLKALAKDPAARYQSVDAFSADIRRYLRGDAVLAHPPTIGYQLTKLINRNRLAFAFGATVILLLAVSGIVSSVLALRLNKQRKAAEQRFQEVRNLAGTLIYDLHDIVSPLQGGLEARRVIVDTGLQYLDALAKEAGSDVSLQLECADGYFRIAEVQGNPTGSYVGQTAEALASCQKGLQIIEHLFQNNPGDPRIPQRCATGYRILGNLLSATGRFNQAIDSFQQAIEFEKPLCAEGKTGAVASMALEKIRSDLAACLERTDRFDEAEAQIETVLEMIRARIQANPNNPETREKLGNSLATLGHVRVQKGDFKNAQEPLQSALEILEPAHESQPQRANLWRSIVSAKTALGRVWTENGEFEKGRRALEWSARALRDMIANDPANVTVHNDLAAVHHFLGKLFDANEQIGEALEQFTEMLRIRKILADKDADSKLAKRDLAVAFDMVGSALRKTGRVDEALARHQSANAIFNELAELDPDNIRNKRSVAVSAYFLGQLYADLAQRENTADDVERGNWRVALANFQESKNIMTALRDGGFLLENEADVIDMLSSEVARCEEALSLLAQPR